jgi:AraC-like DNA-binding protein
VYTESLSGFFILLNDPLLFFGFLSFAFPVKLILKRCWLFLLPATITGFLYLEAYCSYPLFDRQVIAGEFWFSPVINNYPDILRLQWIIQIILNVFSFFYLILYAKILVLDFPKYLRNNFSGRVQLSMKWLIGTGILFAFFAIFYSLPSILGEVIVFPIVFLEIGFGFLVYSVLNNRYYLNADLLESYFTSFFMSGDKKFFMLELLFPERILPFKLSEEFGNARFNRMEHLYQRMIDYFNEKKPYLQKDLTLDDIARGLNTNRTYISQLLTKEKNTSFYDFVNTYRIEEAKRKMQMQPALSLKSIAEECGFSSYTTFIKYFGKKEFVGPAKWKNKHVIPAGS